MIKKLASPVKSSDTLLLLAAVTLIAGMTGFIVYRVRLTKYITAARQRAYQLTQRTKMMTVVLGEQNKSGEKGVATLKEVNGRVVVTLNLDNAPQNTVQPAHIHMGSCEKLGSINYPLTNVVNGFSTTLLEMTLDQLVQSNPQAVNVHKSVSQSGTYVSCGNLSNSY